MKRIIATIFVLVLGICLAGCGKGNEKTEKIVYTPFICQVNGLTAEKLTEMLVEEGYLPEDIQVDEQGNIVVGVTKKDYAQAVYVADTRVRRIIDNLAKEENLCIKDIKFSKSYDRFEVVLNTDSEKFNQQEFEAENKDMISFSLVSGGHLYNAYNGQPEKEIEVKFVGTDGTELAVVTSSEVFRRYLE